MINETNNKYGSLTVTVRDPKRTGYWICACVCGEVLSVRGNYMRAGIGVWCSKDCQKLKGRKNRENNAAHRAAVAKDRRRANDGVINLGNGGQAFVDIEDIEKTCQYTWTRKDVGASLAYAMTTVNGKKRLLHQLVLGPYVDHKDGNGLNNRRSNLRVATRSQQRANTRKMLGAASQYKGVYRQNGKWHVAVVSENRTYYLGSYVLEIDAARAYDKKATELFGDYARLNFPVSRQLEIVDEKA
jgi:hypothetical protein